MQTVGRPAEVHAKRQHFVDKRYAQMVPLDSQPGSCLSWPRLAAAAGRQLLCEARLSPHGGCTRGKSLQVSKVAIDLSLA
jgi:hypothetical protein